MSDDVYTSAEVKTWPALGPMALDLPKFYRTCLALEEAHAELEDFRRAWAILDDNTSGTAAEAATRFVAALEEARRERDEARWHHNACVNEKAEAEARHERDLRELLWLNHGHSGLYGDDGEMQCAACLQHGDYKREPLADLLRNLAEHHERELREAAEAGFWDGRDRKTLDPDAIISRVKGGRK